ncbi:MAG: ATP-binding protein [Acidimicrobiales bacterium]
MDYRPRVVDVELDELMRGLPALAVEGPRGVGKTATASIRADTVFELDNRDQREILAADLAQIDAGGGTVLIDEWQRFPNVWDYVRRRVDAGASPGRFLLTGSAMPVEEPVHSGAGRIAQLRMRPMSLGERDLAEPTVSLGQMLTGERPAISGSTGVALTGYVDEILSSGFPGIRSLPERARRAQLDSYLARVVDRDFPAQGLRVRRPQALRGWLAAYAAATATTTTYERILDAATPADADKPSKTTTIAYRDVLSQLWLLDPVPGWIPSRSHLDRLTQAPKHHLADPALAAHLLGASAGALLHARPAGPEIPRDGSLLGALFESLVTLGLRVYAQAHEATVHHLRTKDGRHEVDLIIERRDQRVLALEVKLSSAPDSTDCRHLLWLREQLGDDLLDAAVITAGQNAYRRTDGIAVIPAVLLGV